MINWKGFGGKRSWSNSRNLNQDSRSPGSRIELGNFRILSRSVNHSTTTFGALDVVSGQRHAPAALYPRRKEPRYALDTRLGGPKSWSGHRV
jgi:hypothetical protein